jgi:hypothetical protein
MDVETRPFWLGPSFAAELQSYSLHYEEALLMCLAQRQDLSANEQAALAVLTRPLSK